MDNKLELAIPINQLSETDAEHIKLGDEMSCKN